MYAVPVFLESLQFQEAVACWAVRPEKSNRSHESDSVQRAVLGTKQRICSWAGGGINVVFVLLVCCVFWPQKS